MLIRGGMCLHCVRAVLDMSKYDLYEATLEGQVQLDRWDARTKGPPLHGSRADRGLVPLAELPRKQCGCDFDNIKSDSYIRELTCFNKIDQRMLIN